MGKLLVTVYTFPVLGLFSPGAKLPGLPDYW